MLSTSQASFIDLSVERHSFIRRNTHPFYSRYAVLRELGSGGFGTVLLAEHKRTGTKRAVKQIPKTYVGTDKVVQLVFEHEIASLLALDHPHIVKLIEYFENEVNYYLVFELCAGPDLFDHIIHVFESRENGFQEEEVATIMRHMLKAVVGCHHNNIIHKDIKPENFMFRSKDTARSSLKMIDLGLAEVSTDLERKLFEEDNATAGTPAYMAPEVVADGFYGTASDMWSLGVISYALFTGEPLFGADCADSPAEILDEVLDADFLERRLKNPSLVDKSVDAKDLLRRLLERDPRKRITPEEALKHPFIRSILSKAGEASDGDTICIDMRFAHLFDSHCVERMERFTRLPTLKRMAMMSAAHLIDDDSVAAQQHTFRMFDQNGDGYVSFAELEDGLRRAGVRASSNLRKVFARVDLDNNDALNYNEFMAATLCDTDLSENLALQTFDMMDIDGDGYISPKDLVDFEPNIVSVEHAVDVLLEAFPELVDTVERGISAEDFVRLYLAKAPPLEAVNCPLHDN
ncbi:calmodulin-domain protein kinase 2, putative [Perkinsus marinus ATCC 50983]|uniref:non-specific serine/threonine protein kinase n=1 Tax=Perkinsus marinus (strain ATCC 50983 / TXsc) TaxID=423536 RepID=C5KK55_PERM5|nr:calmodulin-domain protein kinase 2, putative [Perkinsus marinus ATCC 50983]EER14967.1 calmodulin-domain protein kinase 2, putative [Perkinsus marinus ATCC 50983]|eukprot:XP_002783171.1 calmodulin-domain protein kinase 2, putative [Perkinsus marinus ATCC 50983]